MSLVLPFQLQYLATQISQVIVLFDPQPAFQYVTNPDFTQSIAPGQDLLRIPNVATAGFPASVDFGQFATGILPPLNSNASSPIPLPANSYVQNVPSKVFGGNPINDTYTVLQINTALARIEPGFSRIRVDYQYTDATTGPKTPATQYFDCPFYEGFNVTARELNNIIGYIEGGIGFLQSEINTLSNQVQYALSRELWRGTSVSGQVTTSGPIGVGLETGGITDEESHGFHLDGGCATCNNLMFKSLNTEMDSKGVGTIPSGYSVGNNTPCTSSDFQTILNSYNAPNKASQGNYTYMFWAPTNDSGSTYTSFSMITENTDGTLTYWMTSTAVVHPPIASDSAHIPSSYTYNNSNVYSNNYTNYVTGPVSVEAGSTGAVYSTEFNIATNSYNLTHPKYLASGCVNGTGNQDGPAVATVVGNAISTFTLSTNGNTLPWVRMVTTPQNVRPGVTQVAFTGGANSNKISPANMVYDSGFQDASETWDNTDLHGSGPGQTNGNTGYCTLGSDKIAEFRGENAMFANRFNSSSPQGPSYGISQPMDVVAGTKYSLSAFVQGQGINGGVAGNNTSQSMGIGLVSYTSKRNGNHANFLANSFFAAPNNTNTTFSGQWTAPSTMQVCFVLQLVDGSLNINTGNTLFMGCPMMEESNTYSGYVTGPVNQIIHMAGAPSAPLTLNGPQATTPTITATAIPGGATTTALCAGGTYTVNGSNISSSFALYLGNTQTPCSNVVYNSQFYATFTVPANAQSGNLFFSNGTHNSNNWPVTIVAAPTISSIQPSENQSAGVNITINGTGFGNYSSGNSNVAFYNGQYFGTIQSWTDGQIVVTVPDIKGQGAPVDYPYNTTMTVIVPQCNGRVSHAFTIYSDQSDVLTTSPSVANVDINQTQQFTANLYNPNFDTNQNVTNVAGTTWKIYANEGGTLVNIGEGNSTYGTITSAGLYTAPNTTPPNQTPSVAVIYPFCTFIANDENGTAVNANAASTVFVDLAASLVISPQNSSVQVPGQTQFTATFTENGVQSNVSTEAIWYVNGIQGGNTVNGTIDNTGLYSTPVIPPPTNPAAITATYYLVNNSTTYDAATTLNVIKQPATQLVLNVASQLNIFLGDGRFGYVPQGTNITCNLNEYVYVQFAEQILQNTRLPNPVYMPTQPLRLQTINALDSTVSQVMYNTASAVAQPDGSTLTTRTVVLGIVDPSDGYFHSMWDIANPPAVPADQNHGMSISVEGADQIKAFGGSHTYKGTIMDYVNDLTGGAQKHLDTMMNQSNIMLVGAASYDISSNTLSILKPLRILGISSEKTYGIIGVIPEQNVTVKPNEYVYIDSEQNLKVGKFSEAFNTTNPDIIILGAVLDSFYTTWPLIEGLEADASGVNQMGENSSLKIGPLLIQWGTTDTYSIGKKDSLVTENISFPVKYEKSCSVMVSPVEANGAFPVVQSHDNTLESFNARIMNNQSVAIQTKVSWLSIGV